MSRSRLYPVLLWTTIAVADVNVSLLLRNNAASDMADGKQGHDQRRHVHSVLRQIEGREEQPLQQETKCQTDRGSTGAEDQEQRRAKDQVNLGYADRMVWQNLEEREDESRRQKCPAGKA